MAIYGLYQGFVRDFFGDCSGTALKNTQFPEEVPKKSRRILGQNNTMEISNVKFPCLSLSFLFHLFA
jgi:hypothetical protein